LCGVTASSAKSKVLICKNQGKHSLHENQAVDQTIVIFRRKEECWQLTSGNKHLQ